MWVNHNHSNHYVLLYLFVFSSTVCIPLLATRAPPRCLCFVFLQPAALPVYSSLTEVTVAEPRLTPAVPRLAAVGTPVLGNKCLAMSHPRIILFGMSMKRPILIMAYTLVMSDGGVLLESFSFGSAVKLFVFKTENSNSDSLYCQILTWCSN